MKYLKGRLIKICFLSVIALTFASCSKDDNPTNITPVEGNWRISYFFDSGDETGNFSGYNFQFNSSGVVTASNGANTVNGTWSQTSTKLIINFGTTPVFDDLNDDWLIEEKTSTSIKLKEDNPTQDDRLQFTKI
jgi:hypothetical protein